VFLLQCATCQCPTMSVMGIATAIIRLTTVRLVGGMEVTVVPNRVWMGSMGAVWTDTLASIHNVSYGLVHIESCWWSIQDESNAYYLNWYTNYSDVSCCAFDSKYKGPSNDACCCYEQGNQWVCGRLVNLIETNHILNQQSHIESTITYWINNHTLNQQSHIESTITYWINNHILNQQSHIESTITYWINNHTLNENEWYLNAAFWWIARCWHLNFRWMCNSSVEAICTSGSWTERSREGTSVQWTTCDSVCGALKFCDTDLFE